MGALAGTLTTTVYYIQGDLPDDFRESFITGLGGKKFKDVNPDTDNDESMGWVTINDPFDTDFDLNKILWGDYLMVSLRHDRISLPATAFKLRLQKALKQKMDESGKERLSKAEIEDVKDFLERQLKKQVLPSIKTYDFVWNIQRKQAWFFSTNKKMGETFVELFEATFGMQAHDKNPYTQIEQMGLSEEAIERALYIEPASMAAEPRD